MVGNKLRLKRLACGLSLQNLADELGNRGVNITRATLLNYENGKTNPSDDLLEHLSSFFGEYREFFLEDLFNGINISFFKDPDLINKKKSELASYIQVECEKYLKLLKILDIDPKLSLPKKITVSDDSIEESSQRIRALWNIGLAPISSVCDVLEANGWFIFVLPEDFGLGITSGILEPYNIPFIGYQGNSYIDQLRLSLIAQSGFLYLDVGEIEDYTEILKEFARAVLLPEETAHKEFDSQREKRISTVELLIARKKHGIPSTDIMARLKRLSIVPEFLYENYLSFLRQHGYPRKKTGYTANINADETPKKMNMLAARAVSKKLITPDMATHFTEGNLL